MSLKPPGNIDHPSKWQAHDPWKDAKKHTPGAFPSSPLSEHHVDMMGENSLTLALKARRQDYIRKRNIKIKIGTWNVASISSTHKDLAAWFLQGLGVKGLHQDLSGLSATDDSDYSSGDEHIESVEHQESRANRKQATVPIGEVAAIPSDDDVGLYALGLQEVIDISSFTEAMRPYYDPNPSKKWKHAVKRNLPRGYVKIAEQQLLGLLILVYASPEVAPQVSSVHCTSVGTGALGYVGNKGAVSVRIVLGGTTRLLFVNSHLAAGSDQAALNRRIWDTNQILSRTKFDAAVIDGDTSLAGPESIGDEDFAFWFGDLNYRLDDIPGEDVRRLLLLHTRNEYDVHNKSRMKIDSELGYIDAVPRNTLSVPDADDRKSSTGRPAYESSAEPALDPKDDPASLITTINSLLQHDQLRAQQRLRKAFHDGWREGEINFLPTYKYDIGSVGMFDSGEKKRSPSWCDRILYRTRQDKQLYEERLRREQGARTRDEEMKAKGLDKDAADQEILFDYDPDTDGADNDDDYDEFDDQQDTQSVITEQGLEDTISLGTYISHQRVLSSDHKPLSAVFNLTYDAVIPELKAQVQQEVARLIDRNENETRPNVTVVVDNPSEGTTATDNSAGSTELNSVEFDEVRYDVPKTRTLTIANTGPIHSTFAFINRPISEGQEQGPFPSWMNIEVHHESTVTPKDKDDLGTSTRFVLSPGEIATVDITVHVSKEDFVRTLNEGVAKIEDVLVLRILHGRDHFVSVNGTWCPTSYFRYLDELVRFPKGVRSLVPSTTDGGEPSRQKAATFHSAPKELYELTDALPGQVERAIADWTMTDQVGIPPWESNTSWPFQGHVWKAENTVRSSQLAELREALDTAAPLLEQFGEHIPSLARAELLAETLVSFLQSLQDGIVPSAVWSAMEENVVSLEKSKTSGNHSDIQDIVMEALSATPVHSVSLTFVTFMLMRVITELMSGMAELETPLMSPVSSRARSSTEASEANSELSVTSTDSASSRPSFLPSFSRRRIGTSSAVASPTTPQAPQIRRAKYVDAYAEFWSSILIRSERDTQLKGKEKRTLDARKKKVMAALLDSSSM